METIRIEIQKANNGFIVNTYNYFKGHNDLPTNNYLIEEAKEMEEQKQSYSAKDMINFVEFATQYYANDWMENRSIYELLEQFKNK